MNTFSKMWNIRTPQEAKEIIEKQRKETGITDPQNLEEQALFLSMDEQPETARQTLIEHNLRLVVYIARKFENTGVGIEDLISIGTIGLIKAVKTFDYTKKIKLATYASRCIENEILMFLRRTSRQKLEVSLDELLAIRKEDAPGLPAALAAKYGELDDSGRETVEYIIHKEHERVAKDRAAKPYSLETPAVRRLKLYNIAVSAGTGSYLADGDYSEISVYANAKTDAESQT